MTTRPPRPVAPSRVRGWCLATTAAVATLAGVGTAGLGAAGVAAASPVAPLAPARAEPAQAAPVEQRIEFEPGTDNAWREGRLMPGVTDRWLVLARAGQTFAITIDSADNNHVFSVFAPDRTLLANVSATADQPTTFWTGVLPADGDYTVEVTTLGGEGYYQLKVWIDATAMDPLGLVQRVDLRNGRASARGSVIRASTDSWLVAGVAGLPLRVTVTATAGAAPTTFDVYGPDGVLLTAPDMRTEWSMVAPLTGDYRVAVTPVIGNAEYTISSSNGTAPAPRPQPNDVCDSEIECPPAPDDWPNDPGFCDEYGCGDPIDEPDEWYEDPGFCDEYGCGDPIDEPDEWYEDPGFCDEYGCGDPGYDD